MHINNVSVKTSTKYILLFTLFSVLYTAGIILAYVYLSVDVQKSISGFFSWAAVSFDALLIANPEDPWISWVLFIMLPAIFYIGLIISIIQRYAGLKELASSLNLKSVDFLSDRVKFNFNRPQYDFVCGYSEINNLEMILVTALARSKYGTCIVLNEVKLNFTVLNNKNFSLTNTPMAAMRLIYNIVDCARKVNHFSYKFEGAGESKDLKEKIEEYLHKGTKPVLTSVGETKFKWMSMVFFIIGMVFLVGFKDILNDSVKDLILLLIPLLPVGAFLGTSFIFDIILIVDKIKEKSYRGYNG